jgi:hypothetical protein
MPRHGLGGLFPGAAGVMKTENAVRFFEVISHRNQIGLAVLVRPDEPPRRIRFSPEHGPSK